MVICGEPSGDLNAANLITEIIRLDPEIRISGVGGPLMQKTGATTFSDIKELSVIGLFDVIKKLPAFFSLQKLILDKIKKEKPDAVILVDFSGFNLRLAKKVNRTIPAIYYISPQVWASRSGRIETIRKHINKMIVLFKFEEEFYKNLGIDVTFVGHPLLDIVKPTMEKSQFINQYGLSEAKTIVALLPGSRKQEIDNILPIMLKTAFYINRTLNNVQFVIAKSTQVDLNLFIPKIKEFNIDLKIIEGKTYDCLNAASFALVASGTATLETAIMQKPFFVIYKMNPLNYLLYRPQVKVPFIGMVNIVANKLIAPEFIQWQACPKKIADRALVLLKNPQNLSRMASELGEVKSLLGQNGASERAARVVLEFLKKG